MAGRIEGQAAAVGGGAEGDPFGRAELDAPGPGVPRDGIGCASAAARLFHAPRPDERTGVDGLAFQKGPGGPKPEPGAERGDDQETEDEGHGGMADAAEGST